MASGRVWMAFDKNNPKSDYDRLHFDANANGDLTDDPVCQPYRRESEMAYFGPVKAVFAGADGPITYHLSMKLRTFPGQAYCLLSPACWYEGQITLGKGSQAIPAGANIKGTWLPTTREIVIDIKDAGQRYYVYRGAVNAEGNLVVDRGVIFPQGRFTLSGPSQTIFKKVQ